MGFDPLTARLEGLIFSGVFPPYLRGEVPLLLRGIELGPDLPYTTNNSQGVNMEIIKEALMQWGEAMNLTMENRTMFYSPVLNHWRVKKWTGKNAKSFIYEGDSFMLAFEYLLGTHATEHTRAPVTPEEDADQSEAK